jgi:hypothetical protein
MRTGDSTAPTASGHVDLDAVKAIVSGITSIHEARVAAALSREDLKGLRAIERASGLSRESVLKVIPASGESSRLLECPDRGQFAWEDEDRRAMVVRLRSSADQDSFSSTEELNYVQEIGTSGTSSTSGSSVEEVDQQHSDLDMTAVETLLDPALDIWSNTGGPLAYGDAGWALAMVTRFRPTTFSLEELRTITQLGERQLRRLLAKLGSFVTRLKTGRSVAVTVDFSWMTHEDLVQNYVKTERVSSKARQHQYEAASVQDMKTERGRSLRHIVRNARTELGMMRDWAKMTGSRAWDGMIHILERTLLPLNHPDRMSRWGAEYRLRTEV